MSGYVGAIDQGTTSTRFVVVDGDGRPVGMAQREHEQIYPQPGWVEHRPREIWSCTQAVIAEALDSTGLSAADLVAVGVTNQRETTVVWDRSTGEPVANAIVWQCTRTDQICRDLAAEGGRDRFRASTGLPLATYFAAPKVRWILDNVPGARERAEAGDLLFGTIDTWLIWNLTGGVHGGLHITDVTNASRTLAHGPPHPRLGCARTWPPSASLPRCSRASDPRVRSTARRGSPSSRAWRWPATSATNKPGCSGRPASAWVTPRTPTAPGPSCC